MANKLVSYESDPYMEDTDWFKQGGVVAGHVGNGLSTVLVAKYARRTLLDIGYDEVRGWYHNEQGEIGGNQPFITQTFEWGVSAFIYRAYQHMNRCPLHVLQNLPNDDGRWSMVIAISCNTGDFTNGTGYSETWFRAAGGAIAAIGTATPQTSPPYNNMMAGGTFKGIYKVGHHNPGWGLCHGKNELWHAYNGFDGRYMGFMEWNNLIGDPGTHLWTDIPLLISVEHDETFALGQSRYVVQVNDEEEGNPIENALVCLYKPEEIHLTAYTNDEGEVVFHIPHDALEEGEMMVTVTKHNVKPYLGSVEIEENELFLGAEAWEIDDDEQGDGDGIANPAEEITLTIDLMNFGTDVPEGEISVTAESLSPLAVITSEPVVLQESPAVGESAEIDATIEINPTAPDATEVLITFTVENGDNTWNSSVVFEVESPKIVITDFEFENEELNRGEVQLLNIEVTNTGRKPISAFQATLSSSSDVVMVRGENAVYQALEPNESAAVNGDRFRVQAHVYSVPGMEIELQLAIESEDGFRDTTYFSFNLMAPGQDDPFGPDGYGYVCFDSDDEGWEMAPVYEWIEIDSRLDEDERDFEGVNTNIRDRGDNQDQNTVVELPFPFQYYGEEFNEITICSNGWAALGNKREFLAFRNRHIGQALGPDAQLCVFWDNLITNQGAIFHYYDEETGRFIVEWSDVNRLHGRNGIGESETFELILHDVRLHPTYSGDGIIIYQYKDVTNGSTPAHNDTPYATIGISNLDDSDGLEYTYSNRYTPGAKRLEDEMAIKFTTAVEFITGVLFGVVIDERTREPIAGAQITTTRGFWGETDSLGVYNIDDILIGDGYVVTASAPGYNDSTLANDNNEGYTIVEAETTTVEFALLHPEFNIDRNSFRIQMNAEDTLDVRIILSNDGNGTLEYTSRFTYVPDDSIGLNNVPVRFDHARTEWRELNDGGPVRDDPDEIWDPLLVWSASDSVDDNRIQAVVFVDDHWVVAGSGTPDESNWFYVFDCWGNFLERIPQPIEDSRYGLRDLCYYDNYIYGALPEDNVILRVDSETFEELGRWRTPGRLNTASNLTIDTEGYFWACAVTNDYYKFELVGDTVFVEVQTYDNPDPRVEDSNLRTYGLAWFRDDPDGYNLYMMTNIPPLEEEDPDGILGDISLYKMNPNTGDIRFLTHLPNFDSYSRGRGGISITPKWNNLVWALATVIDNREGDMIGVIELAPNSSWIEYSPRADTLEAGEVVPIEITINTTDLDTLPYRVWIEFTHNATGGVTTVPVDLLITILEAPNEEPILPLEYALEQNWPNPFNPSTSIEYGLKYAGLTELAVFDVIGREVVNLIHDYQPAGKYRVTFDGGSLPAGLYFYRIKSGEFKSVRKMLLVK